MRLNDYKTLLKFAKYHRGQHICGDRGAEAVSNETNWTRCFWATVYIAELIALTIDLLSFITCYDMTVKAA